jgi:hypothetical protein
VQQVLVLAFRPCRHVVIIYFYDMLYNVPLRNVSYYDGCVLPAVAQVSAVYFRGEQT